MTKTFKFKSGHTISTRADYNPRLFNLGRESWAERNPSPEPPVIEIERKIKGGVRIEERADWSDPVFINQQAVWQAGMNRMVSESLMTLAIDRDSMDRNVLEAARAWGEQNGVELPTDDLKLYLTAVAGDGEIEELFNWLATLDGPSDALVSKMLSSFRQQSGNQGADGGHLGSPNGSEPQSQGGQYVGVKVMGSTPSTDVPQGG